MNAKMNIKSIIAIMLIMIIASMLFVNISFATDTGKVIVETAKIRETRDTDSKVLELIAKDEKVEVLEEVDNWYKIKYKSITGYIRADLIQLDNKTTNTTEAENTVETVEKVEEKTDNTEKTQVEEATQVTETTGLEKYTLSENVKLKIIPLISSIELGELSKDVEVEIIETLNNWIKIKTSDGKQGWIIKEKTVNGEKVSLVTVKQVNSEENKEETEKVEENVENKEETTTQKEESTTKTMYANSQTVNVRQKADKSSQVVKQIAINTKVEVLSTEKGWAYVDIDGVKGYIAENLLSTTKQETSRSAITREKTTQESTQAEQATNDSEKETTGSTSGSAVISYAQQFIGCKYVYGGTSTSGFDCSGFTQYVYKHFGVNLNRTAASQYSNGTAVTDLQAGDLVMFGKSGINHVGIYVGGNTFVHAANKERGVTTDTLSSGYYKTNYVGARRIL